MTSLLILNGPNLNLLGQRQPEVYGHTTLDDIRAACATRCAAHNLAMRFEQSNHEGALIDLIHGAAADQAGIVLNAGAFTHTSVALMDAASSVALPLVEVHLSNIHAREPFRHHSYIAPVALGQICGFGAQSYLLAIDALAAHLEAG
jgi:3-dehydroquinate dehydratase-2